MYTNTTGSNNGVVSLRLNKSTRIKAVYFSIIGLAGSAASAQFTVELAKQNVSSLAITDTPETVIASVSLAYGVLNAAAMVNQYIPMDIPVDVGDTLYLNTQLTGSTAPANQQIEVYILT